jgi:hypothetical protein
MLTTGLPDKREKRKTNVIPPASDLGAKKIKTILYLHRLLYYGSTGCGVFKRGVQN